MERYHSPRIAEVDELDGLSLPGEVQLALDDLAGSVREGLLALSVGRSEERRVGKECRL